VKRILFVDDEQGILDGLRRMLRPNRLVWDMTFLNSGAEALSAMEQEPFDVLVTDMRMPAMAGAELLTLVQERFPGTVRIVLSGHADLEASMRSVSVSHQFLAKPCGADTLKKVVDRACELADLLHEPKLRDALGTVKGLPVLPRVYNALTTALAEEDVDIHDIGDIVEQDAGIASKILQLVNSSFFGIRREIGNLRQATSYLGVNTIRDLVLCFEVFQQFDGGDKVAGFSLEREQNHSLLTARIARKLLNEKVAAEQAFLAAMLHDVGKLVLATQLPKLLQDVLEAGAGVTRPFHRVEEELHGVSHAEIGAYILGLWGMAYPVVEAVALHHHPGRIAEPAAFDVLGATHVGDALAREQEGCSPRAIELDMEYLRTVGVEDKLPDWRAIAAEEAGIEDEAA
jgi:HD-like signal output (HDOD) protein